MPATLAIYLGRRYFAVALPLFGVIFFLIYAVDLIELFRRGADSSRASAGALAFLALLRTPFIAEETLPFVALFAAMALFLVLSRRLELVSARSAGVSAWQFIAPVALAAALLGLVATTLFNPFAASMKRRAESYESAVLRGGVASAGAIWLRQRSIDGQAIIHALGRGDGALTQVEVYEFAPNGDFQDRIDAAGMQLEAGRWRMSDAKVTAPNAPPASADTYYLATQMTQREVDQALDSPDTVPFWSLPAAADLAERAGVNAGPYRSRFQELMARPVLLAAMALLAGCFSLRFFRMGGVGIMVSGGVLSGFVLYIVTKLASEFGNVGLLGPLAAGWAPALLACVVGGTVLLYLEDG